MRTCPRGWHGGILDNIVAQGPGQYELESHSRSFQFSKKQLLVFVSFKTSVGIFVYTYSVERALVPLNKVSNTVDRYTEREGPFYKVYIYIYGDFPFDPV